MDDLTKAIHKRGPKTAFSDDLTKHMVKLDKETVEILKHLSPKGNLSEGIRIGAHMLASNKKTR